MRYQVPQFTDVEDKIFGPLTLKQFVYVAGGGGLSFLLWQSLPFIIALPFILAIMGFSLSLAFIQVNKRPLIITVEAAFMYFIHGKLFLWDATRRKKKKHQAHNTTTTVSDQIVPSLSENKLSNLAWSLDINERFNGSHQHKVQ